MGLDAFSARRIDGSEVALGSFAGQVLLVVNTASKCGFTPQYAGLEALQKQYGPRGFSVLGFPCDQFGHQEPAAEPEIAQFCATRFGVSFPLFAKVEVNGPGAHPFWKWLKSQKGGLFSSAIKWNFTKFLIGRDGAVLERFPPTTTPAAIEGKLEAALGASV